MILDAIVAVVVAVLLISAASCVVVGIAQYVDPAATKMADDSEPFGEPEPAWTGLVLAATGAVPAAGAAGLVALRVRQHRRRRGI